MGDSAVFELFRSVRESAYSRKTALRRSRGKRRLFVEQLEGRRLLAADGVSSLPPLRTLDTMHVFPFVSDGAEMESGELSERAELAQRMTVWVTDQLGVDPSMLPDAVFSSDTEPTQSGAVDEVYTLHWRGMEWDFREDGGSMQLDSVPDHAFHNLENAADTNSDGVVSPLDAVIIVNLLNTSPTSLLPNRMPPSKADFRVDVTGDLRVTPQDALVVINRLNGQVEGDPDEGGSDELTPDDGSSSDDSSERSVLAVDDYYNKLISSSTTSYPVVEVDVLANDLGEGLQIIAVDVGALVTVEPVNDPNRVGGGVLRFTLTSNFNGFAPVRYTIANASGEQSSAFVFIKFDIDPATIDPFAVIAPARLQADGVGVPIEFRDAGGNGLIKIHYAGTGSPMAGVLLMFAPAEPPFGISVAGRLSSSFEGADATFYPTATGGAWIYGSLPAVNEILAGLSYEPALGFSAPNGIGLRVSAYVYGAIGISASHASAGISLIVMPDPLAPIAVGDYYRIAPFDGPVRLNVLANDRSPSGLPLKLVGVAPTDRYSPTYEAPEDSGVMIDWTTNEIVVEPTMFTYRSFVYLVESSDGRVSQGKLALN